MRRTAAANARAARLVFALRADLATGQVVDALAGRGLEALLLRGPTIATRLYESGERTYGDCDLLVPERRFVEVEGVLHELGFSSYTSNGLAQHWRRSDGVEIDLHVSLWGVRRPAATLWGALERHRQSLEVGGREVAALDAAATAFVVALHAAQHGAVVRHALTDLERALCHFPPEVWEQAAALAAETGSLRAFRQGLTMLPEGHGRLEALGLTTELSVQAALRRRGVELPGFLLEGLSVRERLSLLGRRIAPRREEVAILVDQRAAESGRVLLLAHMRRLGRLPVRMLGLLGEWRWARQEAAEFERRAAGR